MSKKNQEEYLKKLGIYIVRLREKKGLKQYELSDLLDIDVRVLRRIEKGKTNIQILFLFKLADVLNVKTNSFIDLPKVDDSEK
ncbi:hypothetical protein BTO18_16535 [Polaribacter porphyrae]|uniref:HTH cro/C1-type domain-containing protein n=1 Tax=Polaribacter porphyrae TaxID=1137780 RepID=A0A2S7WTZ1_9FLAO|nr:hypothetical protein BTO18_16535 [Polaribacter porphyrae]